MSEFVIWNKGMGLFWSNDDGWVDIDSATKLSREEINRISHFPAGGSPLELIPKYYEIVSVHGDAPEAPTTYRGQFYALPGCRNCYLAVDKQFGPDLEAWFGDDDAVELLKRIAGAEFDFTNDGVSYVVRIGDESFDSKPRSYLLNVDHDILPKQVAILSELLQHLTQEQYAQTVGAIELLEEIQKQGTKQ